MAVTTVDFYRISCDHPGCAMTTEPFVTVEDAWTAFRMAWGVMFLPTFHRPLAHRCQTHHHRCRDGYEPIPIEACPRCSPHQSGQ